MKDTTQIPSSTTFNPSRWPAMTVEILIFLRSMPDAAASRDEGVTVMHGIVDFGQPLVAAR